VKAARVLIVDDEPDMLSNCRRILERAGHQCLGAEDGARGLEILEAQHPDLLITDLKMPGIDGMELMRRARAFDSELPVIVVTGFATIESAVAAVKEGAFDFLPKTFSVDQLQVAVERALRHRRLAIENRNLRGQLQETLGLESIIGRSPAMARIFELVKKAARSEANILILGESGTGKELIARAIHFNSQRKDRQFVPVDCAVLSENLLESELFGHVKGSFTGAIVTKPGLFEVADGGSLFLDEIGNISMAMQSKLLRFIQEREFTPVGGTKLKKVDVRLIAATNKDLEEKIKEGAFREDLFYRLNIVPISLPPLRERKEDIPLLAMHFLKKYCQDMGRNPKALSQAGMEMLMRYPWPGNVRELENIMERAVIMTEEETILPKHLPLPLQERPEGITFTVPKTNEELRELKRHLRDKAIEEVERLFVLDALSRNDWNVTRSSKDVGMLRPNFQALMRKHNIRSADRDD
jgi:DNA-binding NtrC family response regulator